jgi:ketosteroid isomerase-like protein
MRKGAERVIDANGLGGQRMAGLGRLARQLGVIVVASVLIVFAIGTGMAAEKAATPPAPTAEQKQVLSANEAFYAAFRGRDLKAMDAIWAQKAEVAVIHPGWPSLNGRKNVMESWRGIMDSGAPNIHSVDPKAYIMGDSAFVICYEDVGGGFLIATNIFVHEGGTWRMVHHQAGPTPVTPNKGPRI